MLAKLSPVCSKGTNKAACLGLEAIMAILMSKKLPGMSHEEGRCFNDAHCGYRFWGKGQIGKESLMYVSFEKLMEIFSQLLSIPIFITSRLHTATIMILQLRQAWLRRLPFSHTAESRKSSLRQSDQTRMRRCSISCFSTQRGGGGGHCIQAPKGGRFVECISWCLRLQQWKVC